MAASLFDLSGKTALVTGCNKGIGKAMALGLAEAGADIIGVSGSLAPGSDIEKEVLALGRSFKLMLTRRDDAKFDLVAISRHSPTSVSAENAKYPDFELAMVAIVMSR